MSHKWELEEYTAELNKRNKRIFLVVKIVAVCLAAALLATGILVVVDIARSGSASPSGSENGESSIIKATQGKTVKVKQGATVSYYSLVEVDGKYASYNLVCDSSEVDLNKPGSYTVTYRLFKPDADTEKDKPVATFTIRIVVEEIDENMEELMSLVKAKAEQIGLTEDAVKNMSKEQIVRAIYNFAKDPSASKNDANIYFSDESNIPDIDRDNWETDWVKEATLTLKQSRMKGDCYTYYSVSKAFFEYFGIENVGIRRGSGAESDGTHFWHVVNIGDSKNPKWYYYDATRLAGHFGSDTTDKNSCLITLGKLESYVSTDGKTGFYHFDPSQYPTVEITALSK